MKARNGPQKNSILESIPTVTVERPSEVSGTSSRERLDGQSNAHSKFNEQFGPGTKDRLRRGTSHQLNDNWKSNADQQSEIPRAGSAKERQRK